jgi:hypothetical protein
MSISSLADDEILRTDRGKLNLERIIEPSLNQMMATFNIGAGNAPQLRAALRPVAEEPPIEKTKPSTALDALVKYIPTESVTLYVAATSAISTLTAAFPSLTPNRLYWGFVAFTPILFLLIYIGKRRSQSLRFLPESMTQWPWWKLFAATVAFGFWALAVPPLVSTDAGKAVAAIGALFVSTMLTILGGVFEPKGA